MRVTPEKNKKLLNESTGYVIRASLEVDDFYWNEELDEYVEDKADATIYPTRMDAEEACSPHSYAYRADIDGEDWIDLGIEEVTYGAELTESEEQFNKLADFKSDVYNALSKVGFKYRNAGLTDKDWDSALEWFLIHFFED